MHVQRIPAGTAADFCASLPNTAHGIETEQANSVKLLQLATLRIKTHLKADQIKPCKTKGGIEAVCMDVRQKGCVYIVWNPTAEYVRGCIIPAFPELQMHPFEGRILTTDEPIGASDTLLSAYSGLVKSTATVIAADIRPDPYLGARVVVGGRQGDQHTVVLFHRAGGVSCTFTINRTPTVHSVADNLLIVIPDHLRRYLVTPQAVTAGSYFIDLAGTISTWMQTDFVAPIESSGKLSPTPLQIEVNHSLADRPDDIILKAGTNHIRARFAGLDAPSNTLFMPDGACWCGEIATWRIESA